jgi:hypothetical protein
MFARCGGAGHEIREEVQSNACLAAVLLFGVGAIFAIRRREKWQLAHLRILVICSRTRLYTPITQIKVDQRGSAREVRLPALKYQGYRNY